MVELRSGSFAQPIVIVARLVALALFRDVCIGVHPRGDMWQGAQKIRSSKAARESAASQESMSAVI